MAGETNVGSIAVFITADTNGLERGVARAKSALGAIGGIASQAGLAVAGFGAALATGAVAGLASFVKESFIAVDAAAKFADTVDGNFQALRGIQYAGELAGSSAAGIQDAFKKMNKVIGDATLGNKEAIKSLDQLGLSAWDLIGLESQDQFLKIAQAISSIPIASQKAAAAMDIFGKSGQSLVPLLNEGEAGIQKMMKEFNKLHGVMSREDAKVFEEMNDQVTRLKTSVEGLAETIANKMAPMITKAIDEIIAANNALRKAMNIGDEVKGIFDAVPGFLSSAASAGARASGAETMDMQKERDAIKERDAMMKQFEEEDAKRRLRIYNALMAHEIQKENMRAEVQKKNLDDYVKQSADSQKKLGARAQELLKQSETPLEQYKNSLLEIRELFEKDLLTADQADKVLESATARFKQTENKKTAPVGFAGQIQARGVSAEALRMSNRKTQVEDPQLKTTNLLLTEVVKQGKNKNVGSAVTV